MTPEQHAKAIEDAAEQYAYAYSIDDFKDRSKAFDVLQDAIWAGVSANKMVAAPDGWQLVPVEPTNAMLDALEEGGCSEGNYKARSQQPPSPSLPTQRIPSPLVAGFAGRKLKSDAVGALGELNKTVSNSLRNDG